MTVVGRGGKELISVIQNAECRMQNADGMRDVPAFCILHSELLRSLLISPLRIKDLRLRPRPMRKGGKIHWYPARAPTACRNAPFTHVTNEPSSFPGPRKPCT